MQVYDGPSRIQYNVSINQGTDITCPFRFGLLRDRLNPYNITWFRQIGQQNIPVEMDPESAGHSLNGSNLLLPIITTFSPKQYFCRAVIQICDDTEQCRSNLMEVGPVVSLEVSGEHHEIIALYLHSQFPFVVRIVGFNVTVEPQPQNVTTLESAMFSCSADGRGDFEIDWIYDGTEYVSDNECEEGDGSEVCVNTTIDNSDFIKRVDSTITIPSNMIMESEQIVQCRVTQTVVQPVEIYNATLRCLDCVTTTFEGRQ